MHRITIGFALLTSLACLPGCQTANHTEEGALVGTGLGALTGAIIGQHAGNAGAGALIGAATGAVAGGLAGNAEDAREERDAALWAAHESEQHRRWQETAVTNAHVIQMSQAGVADSVIEGAIRSRGGRFNLSPEGLISLNQQGVSSSLIAFMQQNSTPGPYTATPAPSGITTVSSTSRVFLAPPVVGAVVVAPRHRVIHRGYHNHPHRRHR